MKVNMVVGGRFNAPPMAEQLARHSDLRVYSSVPGAYWRGAGSCVRPIPHLSILYEKLSGRLPSRKFKDFSTRWFSILAASFMRKDAEVIYAWASFGREAMQIGRSRGAVTLLDRACPHIAFQEELLAEEADFLDVPFHKSARHFVSRCIEEYELADIIVVPSTYTMRSFVERGFPETALRLISLGPSFLPKKRCEVQEPNQAAPFVLGVVAGSLLRKGLRYLVEAWNRLQLPNARLRLKCSLGELKKAPALWQAINSNPSIELVGYMKDLEDFYRGCSLFCLPSVDDGFGMVVFESIACGCPVLVTKNVGAADIVLQGETGYIVEARNSESLAERIQALYDDRHELARMSQACVEYFAAYQASPNSFSSQVDDLVQHLAQRVSAR